MSQRRERQIEKVCARCRKPFLIPYSRRRQRHCSNRCAARRGAENNRYNGGLGTTIDGRTIINCRDGTLMLFYRGLMAAQLGRLLRPDELVHHINGDPSDDRLENLQIVTRAEHIEMHRGELLAARGL